MKLERVGLSGLVKSILLAQCVFVLSTGGATPLAAVNDSYSQDVKKMSTEMSTVDCAQCHYEIFMSIKQGRGAHRMECQVCHQTYHSFRQGADYKAALPACGKCHTEPHGKSEKMLDCMRCHALPHAPLASLEVASLEADCTACHADPGVRMQGGSSDHSQLRCGMCHSEHHGYIPACEECHGMQHPQETMAEFSSCLDCHGNPHDLLWSAD